MKREIIAFGVAAIVGFVVFYWCFEGIQSASARWRVLREIPGKGIVVFLLCSGNR